MPEGTNKISAGVTSDSNEPGEYTGFFVHGIEQWSQMRPGYNWRTFHPILIEFEDDRILGGVEFTFVLLGLGFRARWNYKVTEDVQEIKRRLDEVLELEDLVEGLKESSDAAR